PFDLERDGDEVRGIEIALDRPSGHVLAARLLDLAERRESAVRPPSGLFGELALRGGERRLVVAVFALGNRPNAVILLCPERAARMHEQDFEADAGAAVHQEAGAAPRHLSRVTA